MSIEIRRDSFKNFWDKFSDKPDTSSMMLNHSADDLESSDRLDILSSLPILTNKDVVDIGAGIGRFTTVLAETARWVLSTDFIESFIKKNQERNAHLGNINYQVGDAVGLKMDNKSVDLVFTNWLMMYLSDAETVEFIFNTMRWLRPYGVVHLRESCSEPSTGRSKGKSMHNTTESNPTHYRFSSAYINLLRTIRYRDEDNKLWKFNVKWSCSVPTYIKLSNNWRQVHWLAEKVPAEDGANETLFNNLVELLKTTWVEKQTIWDEKLDNEKYVWSDGIFSKVLNDEIVAKNSIIFIYTPRAASPFIHVNSHLLAEKFTCNVWNVETVPEYYRTSLTKSNTLKDKRVRFGWNNNLNDSLIYWQQKEATFDTFIATELLSTSSDDDLKQIATILRSEANIISLEPVESVDENAIRSRLSAVGLKLISIENVTEEAIVAQEKYLNDHNLIGEQVVTNNWVLIHASLGAQFFICCRLNAKTVSIIEATVSTAPAAAAGGSGSRVAEASTSDYRVAVFGAGGVGKSSITQRFVKGTFNDNYVPTIEDTYRQVISCNQKNVCTLQITDTTGSHQFPAMQRLSMSKGHAFILIYSITSMQSLEELGPIILMLKEVKGSGIGEVPIMLVGNKKDEESKREVSAALGQKLSTQWGTGFIETSAKNNENITELFQQLLSREKKRQLTLTMDDPDGKNGKKKGCVLM